MSGDLIRERISLHVTFNCAILDETVGLGKRGKETDGLSTAATEKAPDEDEQRSNAHPTQISGVVTQGPECFPSATVGTLGRWPHPFVETFSDILLRINFYDADYLHEQGGLMLRDAPLHDKSKSRGVSRVVYSGFSSCLRGAQQKTSPFSGTKEIRP
jgi:hypothetical protein